MKYAVLNIDTECGGEVYGENVKGGVEWGYGER